MRLKMFNYKSSVKDTVTLMYLKNIEVIKKCITKFYKYLGCISRNVLKMKNAIFEFFFVMFFKLGIVTPSLTRFSLLKVS